MQKETIQVIERATTLLEILSANTDRATTIKEITAQSGLKQTTVVRIMQTLTKCGLTEQLGRKRGYKLGWKIYKISGNSSVYFNKLKECAAPLLQELAGKLSETIVLAGLTGNSKTIILKSQSEQEIIISDSVESENNPLMTITGKLLMAYLPPLELEHIVDSNGGLPSPKWPALTDIEKLTKDLSHIRKAGMATYEKKDLYNSVAVPIFDGQRTIAALGCSIPTLRFKAKKDEIIKEIKTTASKVSTHL